MALAQAPIRLQTLRAAIYCRVSTAVQEQEGTSLGTQEVLCRQYAAEHGLVVDELHVYRETHTGVELWERPKLASLREAVRRREIGVVVAYAIDRLSRDPVHLGVIISEAEQAGADVQFVSEPLDSSPEGQLIRYVRGYAAKVEHAKTVERTRRGLQARLSKGMPLVGPRPIYGYLWADAAKSRLEPDPIAAPTVRRIFDWAAGGVTTREICRRLTDDRVPRPSDGALQPWRPSTVRELLIKPTYAGRTAGMRYRVIKDRSKGIRTHRFRAESEQVALPGSVAPALVSAEVFEAVQVQLVRNQQRAARNNRHPEAALLRGGYLRCGHCGGPMAVSQSHPPKRDGESFRYFNYICQRSRTSKKLCEGASMSTTMLDAIVWKRVSDVLTDPSTIATELERTRGNDPTEADLVQIDRALGRIGRLQTNLVDSLAEQGAAVAALIGQRLADLDQQRAQLEEDRRVILGRRAAWESAQRRIDDLQAWCRSVAVRLGTLTYQQKQVALDALSITVTVWRAGSPQRFRIKASIPLSQGICERNPTQFRSQMEGMLPEAVELHWSDEAVAAAE